MTVSKAVAATRQVGGTITLTDGKAFVIEKILAPIDSRQCYAVRYEVPHSSLSKKIITLVATN